MFVPLLLSLIAALQPQIKGPAAVAPSTKATVNKAESAAAGKPASASPNPTAGAPDPAAAPAKAAAPAVGKSSAPSATPPANGKRRLPRFFSQLELDDAQQQKVQEVQGRFAQQIAQLRQQIAALQAQREVELDGVLKPAQKRLLKQLRTGQDATEP